MSNKIKLIQDLRKLTGAGMLDVKKALDNTNYDFDKAVAWLKENGIAKAAKKAGRTAAEGIVDTAQNESKSIIFEINTETDFVASNEKFLSSVKLIKEALLSTEENISDREKALKVKVGEETIEELLIQLSATIGENISFRRAIAIEGKTGVYTHSNFRIASIIKGESEKEKLRDVAIHASAMQPEFKDMESITEEYKAELSAEVDKEYDEKMADKPKEILENIKRGAMKKKLSEVVLTEQDFVKDPSKKVKDIAGGKIEEMIIFNLGEGIEKAENNFAEEVASAVNG